MQPLRIIHLTSGSDAGGLSRYIYDLAMAMHSQGHEVSVAGQRGAWHWLFAQSPLPWIDVPLKGNPLSLYRATRQLRTHLEQSPVDLLHVHYRRPMLVARRLQKQFGMPILYTSHLSGISLNWWRRQLTDFGDVAHAASEEVRQWLIEDGRMPAEKVRLIPHGVDPARFPPASEQDRATARTALGLKPDDLVIVCVGRWDFPKNEEWMLDLAGASRSQLPRLKVLLVGEGPHERFLRSRIASENLGDRVQLLGHRDPLPIYQAADALLSPSMREGFSLVCAEAMSVGLPIFRTRSAGYSLLVQENITGRTCEIDRQAFVQQAMDFLSDPHRLAEMGRQGARLVRERFSFDQQHKATLELYREMIAARAK